MLHVPIIAAPPPTSPVPASAPLAAAAYIKLRREAAGLTIRQVASIIAPKASRYAEALSLVTMLETDGVRARHTDTLIALRKAFPFDIVVYRQLADDPADRHPTVCRGCGCSEWDPCRPRYAAEFCGWENSTTCTGCADLRA